MIKVKPMLCKAEPEKFISHAKDSANVVVSPKLDGVRCLATICIAEKDIFFNPIYTSRNNKEFFNFKKFDVFLASLAREIYKNYYSEYGRIYLCFDGEVVSKDEKFSSVMTQVRRLERVDPSIFQFRIFDFFVRTESTSFNVKFFNRYAELLKSYDSLTEREDVPESDNVSIVPHEPIYDGHLSVELLNEIMNRYKNDGFEGCVFKTCDHYYQYKKHVSWLKMKPFYTVDLPVVGFENGSGKYSKVAKLDKIKDELSALYVAPSETTFQYSCHILKTLFSWSYIKELIDKYSLDYLFSHTNIIKEKIPDMIGSLIVKYKGVEVSVGTGFTDLERVEFYDDTPKIIEVSYQEVTKDGSLRFPAFVRVRDDKDETD